MSRRVLLCTDLSNLLYRQCSVHSRLTSGDVFTGGLYGFMDGLTAAIRRSGATDLVICRDTKPYRRAQVYPEYKASRAASSDPDLRLLYLESLELVEEFIGRFGIPSLARPGFESDDLIGYLVRQNACRFDLIVAQSTDADLFQLFRYPNFRVFGAAKEKGLRGPDHLRTECHGATPDEYLEALAIAGTHNEVEGVRGVGLKTALQIIRDPVRLRKTLAEHGPMIARNRGLIRLPHPDVAEDGPIRLPAKPARFDLRALYRYAAGYDINIRPDMATAFEAVLSGR